MLKEKPGRESLRHLCNNWSPDTQMLEIYLHDNQAHALVIKTGVWAGNIKFCPYCGVEIEKEAWP